MHEILKENFEAEFPNIKNDFQDAAFFAIDNEFSGLLLREKLRLEWFLFKCQVQKNFMTAILLLLLNFYKL